ncbi:MAG: Flp pilus assembly complex ATPase component TadA [bacterium]|nr:Flp pilus assembly complex ATPase component TadA [bacterium]
MMHTKAPGLGEFLISKGVIDQAQLAEALVEQKRSHERLGEILQNRGLITEWDLLDALGSQLGHRLFDAAHDEVTRQALELVPAESARRYDLLPVCLDEHHFVVAMKDPLDVEALDHLHHVASRVDRELSILLAPAEALAQARDLHYGRLQGDRNVSQLIESVIDEIGGGKDIEIELEGDGSSAQDAGVVTLVDQIIGKAIQERATDIHVEPQEHSLVIRYRVDGILYDALTPPRAVYAGAVSRLKIMANMDIAERRTTQDGRFTFRRDGREVDMRVSAIPTVHGEKIVMRLLDKTNFNYSLTDLGLAEQDIASVRQAIHRPHGMILLSGPTGSGKTTTLYAAMKELDSLSLNITTIEDPVEYQIGRINQVQVNKRKQVTFANALRAFLRQDPDVIMVGEIRDQETAEIAIRAALTGHMVFSTIHANDAPSTAARLVSMGAEPFMAASALTLVAAQRLVRRNCPRCLQEYEPAKEILMALGEDADDFGALPDKFLRGAGCAACRGRGYAGRVAVIEKMEMTPALRELVAQKRPAGVMKQQAVTEGMLTLQQAGLKKVRDGVTTLEEVLRVCISD